MSDTPDVPLSVGAFVRQAIGEGMGVTEARSLFRQQGIGEMSNEAFGQLFGQVRAAVGRESALAGIDYNAIPPTDVYTDWAAGEAGRFSSFVEVYVREPGTRSVSSRFYNYVTDGPHSPQEAVDAAMQVMSDAAADQGTDFDAVVLGGVVSSMTRMTGRG